MKWEQAKVVEGGVKIPYSWVFLTHYEAFNMLFRIENALRVFVYIILKNEFREKWVEAQIQGDDEQGTISALSKKRISQAQSFGYLGHSISCPMMHLNSGELIRLIVSDTYWKLFKPYFFGSKEIIRNKLEEIGAIRNSLAHFRPIKADDIDVIKQNSKQVLMGVEKLLSEALIQTDVVPTNTTDDWYRSLKPIGTDMCTFSYLQSGDGEWICIRMNFTSRSIKRIPYANPPSRVDYTALCLRSSAILIECPEIAKAICYLSEIDPSAKFDGSDAVFSKWIELILSRRMLSNDHETIKQVLEDLIINIAEEVDQITNDSLARGKYIHAVPVSARQKEYSGKNYWSWDTERLSTAVSETDPPEYWGNLHYASYDDIIACKERYPWMPEAVSENEFPF